MCLEFKSDVPGKALSAADEKGRACLEVHVALLLALKCETIRTDSFLLTLSIPYFFTQANQQVTGPSLR